MEEVLIKHNFPRNLLFSLLNTKAFNQKVFLVFFLVSWMIIMKIKAEKWKKKYRENPPMKQHIILLKIKMYYQMSTQLHSCENCSNLNSHYSYYHNFLLFMPFWWEISNLTILMITHASLAKASLMDQTSAIFLCYFTLSEVTCWSIDFSSVNSIGGKSKVKR